MASSSSSSSRGQREQLKETLQALEAFELPDNIQDAFSNPQLNPALIQRYKDARDLYLRRQIQSLFLAHIGTYDGHTIQEVPDRPSEEDEEEAKERLSEAQSIVTTTAQELHQQTLELQQKHHTFCTRREELKKLIEDMDKESEKKKGDANNETMDMEMVNEEEDVDEDALAQEEERLAMLQQKKAQLEVKLNRMRQEAATLKLKTERTESQVSELLGGQELPSPTSLQAEAAETEKKLKKLREMRDFYDGVRGVMEQLNGLQILEVTNSAVNEPQQSSAAKENETEQKQIPQVFIRVRAMEKHDIKITLRSSSETQGEWRVTEAKFLTSTIARAPVDGTAAKSTDQDDNGEDDNHKTVLKLTIPPLDDLVKLCAVFPPGEDLRFLVREAMARIRMIEARVVELAVLHNNVLTKIGAFHHNGDGFGGEEQEVVCSLNECITVVLRLTADCPNVPGSVYISQLVGVGGWDDATVTKIQEAVTSQEFKTPWSLIQAIQGEISRLQNEEGLSLPKTPSLPLRRKKT